MFACEAHLRALILILVYAAAHPLVAQNPPKYTERVDVARVLVDARVVDGRGDALEGLTSGDFEVRIDGKPARVESVQWVAGALRDMDTEEDPLGRFLKGDAPPPAQGRLVVFLFQKSLEGGRIGGFMRMLLDLRPFLDGFTRQDRLAVLSFDSRLRLWMDFTSDVERIRQVFAENLLFGGAPPEMPAESPSLAERIPQDQAERTYTIESALRLLGDALRPLPGAKAVVLVGHGFGRLGPSGVVMEPGYDAARDALLEARASVFCLDVTNADYHSLEAGLQIVSEDSGGFYERTHIFGLQAIQRLAAALAGHYVLIVEKPDAKPGRHRLDVRLKGRRGTVLARKAYID